MYTRTRLLCRYYINHTRARVYTNSVSGRMSLSLFRSSVHVADGIKVTTFPFNTTRVSRRVPLARDARKLFFAPTTSLRKASERFDKYTRSDIGSGNRRDTIALLFDRTERRASGRADRREIRTKIPRPRSFTRTRKPHAYQHVAGKCVVELGVFYRTSLTTIKTNRNKQ